MQMSVLRFVPEDNYFALVVWCFVAVDVETDVPRDRESVFLFRTGVFCGFFRAFEV